MLAPFLPALAACVRDEPRWIALAALSAQRAVSAPARQEGRERLVHDADGDWIEIELARADWRRMERPGQWRAIPPLRQPGRGLASRARLTSGTRTFEQQR